jgi:response regulator RpfG family c-di-GMP phosphodiesterase
MEERVRLLFVDDDELTIAALKRVFAKEPYELYAANSGAAALQLLSNRRIDIIVCDQNMPGMSGVEFLERVYEKHRNVMRVMLSGVGSIQAMKAPSGEPPASIDLATKSKLSAARNQLKQLAYNDAQVHRFLEKPWNDTELRSVVADMAAIVRSNRKRPSA